MTFNTPRDAYVTVRGRRFHFRERGDGPHVLMLHGLTGHSWEWDLVATALSERFHVVALDQRGHGASDWAEDYAPEAFAADVAGVVRTFGFERTAIVGHSLGAIAGYLYASAAREQMSALALLDAGPATLSSPWVREMVPAFLRSMMAPVSSPPEAVLAEWLDASPRAQESELRRYVLHNLLDDGDGRWRWRFDARGLLGFVTAEQDEDRQWDLLRRIEAPALVLRGAESPVLARDTAERMARALPAGELAELPEAAHDLHTEQPERLIAVLREFLESAHR